MTNLMDLALAGRRYDQDRLPHEVKWAVENSTDPALIEMVTRPVNLTICADTRIVTVVDGNGAACGEFPDYRLLEINWDVVAAYLSLCALSGGGRASEALTIIRQQPDRVEAPADLDFVIVNFRDGYRMVFHRREGIPDWPTDCRRYLAQQHRL
jgi:hypothetical protein